VAIGLGVVLLVLVGTRACVGREAVGARIVTPHDGATVPALVTIVLRADGARLEPAGAIHSGAGHLHVAVDTPCVGASLPIETTVTRYWHIGGGGTMTTLELPPGRHRLCAQLGDGAHVAFGATDTITVTVK
jgi:hypothetical protein